MCQQPRGEGHQQSHEAYPRPEADRLPWLQGDERQAWIGTLGGDISFRGVDQLAQRPAGLEWMRTGFSPQPARLGEPMLRRHAEWRAHWMQERKGQLCGHTPWHHKREGRWEGGMDTPGPIGTRHSMPTPTHKREGRSTEGLTLPASAGTRHQMPTPAPHSGQQDPGLEVGPPPRTHPHPRRSGPRSKAQGVLANCQGAQRPHQRVRDTGRPLDTYSADGEVSPCIGGQSTSRWTSRPATTRSKGSLGMAWSMEDWRPIVLRTLTSFHSLLLVTCSWAVGLCPWPGPTRPPGWIRTPTAVGAPSPLCLWTLRPVPGYLWALRELGTTSRPHVTEWTHRRPHNPTVS